MPHPLCNDGTNIMMQFLKGMAVTAGLAALLLTGPAIAEGEFDKPIKARKALMQIYSFNLGQLGAMAKGEAEYNSELAADLAQNLLAAAKMKNAKMWPQGSDNVALPEMTRALPETWSTYPKVAEKQKALVAALETFAPLAGKDLESLQGGIKAVGGGCGGCHKPFRAEKKS